MHHLPCSRRSEMDVPLSPTPLSDRLGFATLHILPSDTSSIATSPFVDLEIGPSSPTEGYVRDLSYPVVTSPQLPVSEDFSITISYLCCILLLINQECVKANPEDSRAGVSRPTIKK